MLRLTLLLAAVCLLAWPAIADDAPARAQAARQSAIVVVICEDGGRSPAGRTLDRVGRLALAPFVSRRHYRTRVWLVGAKATGAAFIDAVRRCAASHKAVDVLMFVHGMPKKTYFADGPMKPRTLISGLKGKGGARLRMVYTTACYSQTYLSAWKAVGAYAVRGMSGVNRPLDFPRFWLAWLAGKDYATANKAGLAFNTRIHKAVNLVGPRIRAATVKARKDLKTRAPVTEPGKQAKQAVGETLRLMHRWFKVDWDVAESTPVITGGDARIDRLPPQRRAKTPSR